MSTSTRFPYELRSVPAARRFVREQLRGYPDATVEAVELMLSELASNSIRHAGSGFEVSVRIGKEIRVEVSDFGAGQPHLLTPRATDPSGRGLRIVAGLASEWGVSERRGGKTVWFTLAAGSPGQRRRAVQTGAPST
jgi:anti-sigma regulatory factor (Ser/Thr protein kinase)